MTTTGSLIHSHTPHGVIHHPSSTFPMAAAFSRAGIGFCISGPGSSLEDLMGMGRRCKQQWRGRSHWGEGLGTGGEQRGGMGAGGEGATGGTCK